jgi:hypothetical protein
MCSRGNRIRLDLFLPCEARASCALDESHAIGLFGKLKLTICARPEPRAGFFILRDCSKLDRGVTVQQHPFHPCVDCMAQEPSMTGSACFPPVSAGEPGSGVMRFCLVVATRRSARIQPAGKSPAAGRGCAFRRRGPFARAAMRASARCLFLSSLVLGSSQPM